MTDGEIIKLVLQGEKEEFRMLVEKYQQMVFRTCMGFLHDKDDADDLTQDIFIQAYQSLSSFKSESAFSTWLYRIAVNASLNKVRKSSKNLILQRIDAFFGIEMAGDWQMPQRVETGEVWQLVRAGELLRVRDEVWDQDKDVEPDRVEKTLSMLIKTGYVTCMKRHR